MVELDLSFAVVVVAVVAEEEDVAGFVVVAVVVVEQCEYDLQRQLERRRHWDYSGQCVQVS